MNLDPVTAVVAATGLSVLVVFGVLEKPAMTDRLGGGFRGKALGKALGGFVYLTCAGIAAFLAGVPLSGWGVHLTDPGRAALWTLVCLVVFLPVIAYSSTRPGAWETTPEIRTDRYGPAEIAVLVGAWSAYLLGYELLFRGLLTFQLTEHLGLERGLVVMTALYVLAHLTKRPAEAFSTIFVGPLFGWVALQSGGFWPVMLIHVAMAVTAGMSAAMANPAIEVGRR